MKNLRLTIALLVGLPLISIPLSQSFALSTDRDQPAEVEADDIEFDFKKGTRTYIDNVLIIQGTLRVKADKLVGIYKDDKLETATAWGSLARFKQRPDGKDDDVEGWAKKIIVDEKNNTLTLVGQAALKQGPNTARGETIVYNMANDTLKIKSGAKLGVAGKDGQAKPERTEDPFKDNNQGPAAEPSNPSPVNATASESALPSTEGVDPIVEAAPTIQPVPTRSGRSRLIIQPKSKTE